ncbi:MAG: LAGLIDADG family homing endonuclease, partial [Nanoarchaeota archaeon]
MIKIKDLFDQGKFLYNDEAEVRSIINIKTISLNEIYLEPTITEPKLISRRLVSENESLIGIETNESKLTLTENHLIYVFRDKKIKLIPAKELRLNDCLISLVQTDKDRIDSLNNNLFNADRFKIQNNQYVHKFAQRMSQGIKVRKIPISWSNELAWLLGYYYGDGSYSSPKYNGSHSVYFTTVENKALSQIISATESVFGAKPYDYSVKQGHQYKVNLNAIMSYYLISNFPTLVKKQPFDMPSRYVGDFLRGFFDADGNVHLRENKEVKIKGIYTKSHSTPRIKITLGRYDLIIWVYALLSRLGIKPNKLHKGKAKLNNKYFDYWTIYISGRDQVERFALEIGFNCDYKRRILFNGLTCSSPKYVIIKHKLEILKLLKNKHEASVEDICGALNLSKYHILKTLNVLYKQKIISKKRRKTSQNWNCWTFSLKDKEYANKWFKLLYKKIRD